MYILATTSFTAISRLTWEIAAFQRIFTKTNSFMYCFTCKNLDIFLSSFSRVPSWSCSLTPPQEHHWTQSNSRGRRYKTTLAEMQIPNPLFFSISKLESQCGSAQPLPLPGQAPSLVSTSSACLRTGEARRYMYFCISPSGLRPPHVRCQTHVGNGKKKKKSRQGETDSLTMSITWEGCKVRHQQCIYSFKCGHLQDKYSATFTKVN